MRSGISRWWVLPCVIVAAGMTLFGLSSAALGGVVGIVAFLIPMIRIVCPLFTDGMDRLGPLCLGAALNVALWSAVLFYLTAWIVGRFRRIRPGPRAAA